MLTTSTFYQLPYKQQADKILADGIFIQSRKEKNFIVDLFELYDLLVEVFYQKETEDLVSIMAYNINDKIQMRSKGINLAPRLNFKMCGNIYPSKEFCA